MIKILHGSVVSQTVLGGLVINPPVANFLQCKCAKNYENWLEVDKIIAAISKLTFLPTLYIGWVHHSIHGLGWDGPVVKFSKNVQNVTVTGSRSRLSANKVEAVVLVRLGCEMGRRPTGL